MTSHLYLNKVSVIRERPHGAQGDPVLEGIRAKSAPDIPRNVHSTARRCRQSIAVDICSVVRAVVDTLDALHPHGKEGVRVHLHVHEGSGLGVQDRRRVGGVRAQPCWVEERMRGHVRS